MVLFNCRIFSSGDKSENSIAVTFDDGPHPRFTPRILEVLERYQVKATFFSPGENIYSNRSTAEEIVSQGHLMGNHTFSHVSALRAGKSRLLGEVVRTKELIENITGESNRFLRPPYGHMTPALLSICRNLDLSIVLWSFNSWDFRGISAERIVNRAKRKISPGSILLFHDCHFRDATRNHSATVNAIDSILEDVLSRGMKPVTVAKLLDDQ